MRILQISMPARKASLAKAGGQILRIRLPRCASRGRGITQIIIFA
jgi:hypothetical protein